MTSRPAKPESEGYSSNFRPSDGSILTDRSRSQCTNAEKGKGRALLTKRMASASPLRSIDTNRMLPIHRPMLSARASTASRASTLPVTPLDDIPEKIWHRVFPSTTTPETSNPELSLADITSTRLSLDEEAILNDLPREISRKASTSRRSMKAAFDGMFGENNGRLKKITKKLKTGSLSLFTRKNRRSLETLTQSKVALPLTPDPSLPQLQLTTELCIPTTRESSKSDDFDVNKHTVALMDYECRPKQPEPHPDEMAKISSIILRELHEDTIRDRSRQPPLSSGHSNRLPRHYNTAPTYTYAASSSTINSMHIAEDRLLHGPRSLKAFSRHSVARAPSIGSVEEMRSLAFGNRRASRPSLSGCSIKHNSAPSVSRISQSMSRPATHAGSISSISTTIVPRKPVMFMDATTSCAEMTWSVQEAGKRPSTLSSGRPVSKGTSTRNSQDDRLSVCSSFPMDVQPGGDVPGFDKVPLFVPRMIEKKPSLPSSKQEKLGAFKHGLFLHPESKNSDPTISDTSCGSLQGQTSIQSHLDRKAMIEQDSQSGVHSNMTGREKITRALESTARRWQKGHKQQLG